MLMLLPPVKKVKSTAADTDYSTSYTSSYSSRAYTSYSRYSNESGAPVTSGAVGLRNLGNT